VIPEAAVEAARSKIPDDDWLSRATVRKMLEAASPHMLAEAWEAGREVGVAQDFEATTQITSPYRSQG